MVTYLALSPCSIQFSMLYAEKQEGLVREITCVKFRWKGDCCVLVVSALAHA